MAEQRIQYVASADGTQIAYTTIGEGAPVVIAANAWGDIALYTSPRSPARFSAILDEGGIQTVIYDGRGSGNSDRGVADFSLAARLADLEAVVDRLALERFALLGVVHGCSPAVAYAAAHSERVTRLALFGVYPRGADYYAATPMLRAVKALHKMAGERWFGGHTIRRFHNPGRPSLEQRWTATL